jgi:hypothetical protein
MFGAIRRLADRVTGKAVPARSDAPAARRATKASKPPMRRAQSILQAIKQALLASRPAFEARRPHLRRETGKVVGFELHRRTTRKGAQTSRVPVIGSNWIDASRYPGHVVRKLTAERGITGPRPARSPQS